MWLLFALCWQIIVLQIIAAFFIDDPDQYFFVLFFPSYDKIDDLKNTSGYNLLIIRLLTNQIIVFSE